MNCLRRLTVTLQYMPMRPSSVQHSTLGSSNIGSNTAGNGPQSSRTTTQSQQQPSAPSIKLATASGIRTSTASGNLTSSMAKLRLGNGNTGNSATGQSTISSTALPSKYQPSRPPGAAPSASNPQTSGRPLTKQPSSATSSSSSLAPTSVPGHLTVNSQGVLQGDIGTYDGGFERDMQSREVVRGESARVLALDSSVGP